MAYGCGDVSGQVCWMGGGKPPLPHHPPQDVPIQCRARAKGGGMDDILGLPTQPSKVGPEGRHLHQILQLVGPQSSKEEFRVL